MNLEGFDARSQPDWSGDRLPVPDGEYTAFVINSEERETKKGTGSYLALEFKIVSMGVAKDRSVYTILNLKNHSEQARKIAYSELGAICKALDIHEPKSSTELHAKPLNIIVKNRVRGDDPTRVNTVIVNYKPERALPLRELPKDSEGGSKASSFFDSSDTNKTPF